MIKITFPDGSIREYENGITGMQIAESISPALARNIIACSVNGETTEVNRPINSDARIELYKFDDEQGKHSFWHTSAHLLAEALQHCKNCTLAFSSDLVRLLKTDSSMMSCYQTVR